MGRADAGFLTSVPDALTTGGISLEQQRAIEQLLFAEARLLDAYRYDDWLRLYTDDCLYWIPCNSDDIDPVRHISIVYDDRARLLDRVWRTTSGLNYGQEPPSRTTHVIGNIVCAEEAGDGQVVVSSSFILVELRRGVQSLYSGRCEHHLVTEGETWKIRQKKIYLLQNDEPLGNLSFIL